MELKKSHNHSHFWIEDNHVYESYNTLRGLRYMLVAEVKMPDNDRLSNEDIERVNIVLKANSNNLICEKCGGVMKLDLKEEIVICIKCAFLLDV